MNAIMRMVIQTDYDKAQNSINAGSFQVSAVYVYDEDEHEIELTNRVDRNKFYRSVRDVATDLGLHPDSLDIEEEYLEK
ncbi:hypothetical protein [Saccharibacillus endophyticus]|uniref:Phage protein n=1 Tax=Saccharibacillus endophyticus TaxID=2060666 RepID=A0ABQ2A353_9BACL|nr:hypothetical protein [Saccharibacillus endophyticus]GGH83485.1 hypothetical protein GCM10007362_36400 [Saccharibacillus endophyticus]